MTPGLGLSLVRRGARAPGFTPQNIATLRAWLEADGGPQKTGPAPAGDGETIATILDSTGNANTFTRTAASTALVMDIDGGPNGGPAIVGTGGAFARTFGTALTSPWFAAVVKMNWAGTGAASLIVDSSASPRFYCSRYSATLLSIASGTVVNANAVVDNEWGLLIVDWGTEGAFNWSGQVEKIINTGTNANANFVFGRDYAGNTPTHFALADLMIGDGVLTREDRINLRAWAARKYGFTFPSDTEFLDTFNRADAGPTIGTSDSGHTWQTLSSNARILSNKLTFISPWTTLYAPLPLNFVPGRIEIDLTNRAGGGAGTNSSAFFLIGTAQGSYDPCFHLGIGNEGYALQEFEAAAVVNVHVVSGKNYSNTGTFIIVPHWEAGTVTITEPDGATTVIPWNTSGVVARPLASYKTPWAFAELSGNGTTNTRVYEFDRIKVRA